MQSTEGKGQRDWIRIAAETLSRKLPNPESELGRVQAIMKIIADAYSQSGDGPTAQTIITEWAAKCFGDDQVNSPNVRALRLAEESIEFAQAVEVDPAKLHKLIDYVYGREKGTPSQELGGVAVTALVAASSIGVQFNDVMQAEIDRILAKPIEHFAKRNQDKVDAGFGKLSGAGPTEKWEMQIDDAVQRQRAVNLMNELGLPENPARVNIIVYALNTWMSGAGPKDEIVPPIELHHKLAQQIARDAGFDPSEANFARCVGAVMRAWRPGKFWELRGAGSPEETGTCLVCPCGKAYRIIGGEIVELSKEQAEVMQEEAASSSQSAAPTEELNDEIE